MKNRTSGRFSCSHCCTGTKPANIGAQTGSVCLFASSANPIVGVCEEPVPPTPLDLIHRMLLKMLCRTSNARWRMAALVPNGTHGLSFSEAPTKVPGTAYRLITSRCSSGTSTILYAVDGGAVMGLGFDAV